MTEPVRVMRDAALPAVVAETLPQWVPSASRMVSPGAAAASVLLSCAAVETSTMRAGEGVAETEAEAAVPAGAGAPRAEARGPAMSRSVAAARAVRGPVRIQLPFRI